MGQVATKYFGHVVACKNHSLEPVQKTRTKEVPICLSLNQNKQVFENLIESLENSFQ